MTPDRLVGLLNDLRSAADVVDAIDDPELQRQRGWDLSHWNYNPVPWGVRFTYQDNPSKNPTEIVALVAFEESPNLVLEDQGHRPSSLTIRLLS